ncbi:MAG: IS4 family transposase [Rhodobacteraceae bacterium]|nr:IS4 family transposase [Paracoccaceae bacterium]
MTNSQIASLLTTLRPHFDFSKSRLTTFCVLLTGLAVSRTVNLSHLACHFPGGALHRSNYRRLQRFFQHVRLDADVVARLVVIMLGLEKRKLVLALDRTNWKLGNSDINILVLAVITRRFRVPLMWSFLAHGGSSDHKLRCALMGRFVRRFGADQIEMLLADREFVGGKWLEYLNNNSIPFAIRLKANMLLHRESGPVVQLSSLLRNPRGPKVWSGWLADMPRAEAQKLTLKCKRIKGGEALIIATNTGNPGRAFNMYRRRWGIECLFAHTKSRGLNLEDTHITSPAKLGTMLCLVTLAIAWGYKCATAAKGRAAIPRKTHGRPEKSWFRIGFDQLRSWLLSDPDRAVQRWRRALPKRPVKCGEIR